MADIHILATIETDPTRYHGEHAALPRLLDRAGGEQVLAHLAADLTRMFPEIARRIELQVFGRQTFDRLHAGFVTGEQLSRPCRERLLIAEPPIPGKRTGTRRVIRCQ